MKPLSDLSDEGLSRELGQSRTLSDAPESVIQRALGVFQPRAQRAATPSLLQRVLASLAFDSAGVQLQAQGVRGSALTTRQMLFSTDGRDIDLRIAPAEGSLGRPGGPWVIFGQLLSPDRAGVVELTCGQDVRQVELDEMLEFRFDRVPGGPVRLAFHLADRVIELPALEVPSPPSP